jgi:hypothetical protein
MKSGFTIIAALLLMLQPGETHAANLKYVRTAKHQDFTRIVFEFRNTAQFKEPVIHGEGKFSVAFPDSTTVLPRQIFYRTTQIQPVYSIEFIQKQTLLTAVIKLSFSEFKLKAFSLSDPNRVVIDAYKTIPPPGESMPEASLHSKSMAKKSMETEIKDPKAVPEESPAKELTRVVKKDPKGIPDKFPATQTGNTFEIKKNAASDIIQDQIEDITKGSLNQVPAALIKSQNTPDEPAKQRQIKSPESLPSMDKNYTLQTYMLVLLNFLTIIIVLLLSFNLWKKKSGINSKPSGKIPDSLNTADERIAAVDAMINNELKKHDFR